MERFAKLMQKRNRGGERVLPRLTVAEVELDVVIPGLDQGALGCTDERDKKLVLDSTDCVLQQQELVD